MIARLRYGDLSARFSLRRTRRSGRRALPNHETPEHRRANSRRKHDEETTSSDSRGWCNNARACRRRSRTGDRHDNGSCHRPRSATADRATHRCWSSAPRAAHGRMMPDSTGSPPCPPGTIRIRVIRLGYEAETRTLTVNGSETVTADFALGATATRLDQVVVSATGESELRRESGNNVATINTDSIPKTRRQRRERPVCPRVRRTSSSRRPVARREAGHASAFVGRTVCRCRTSRSSSLMVFGPSAMSRDPRSTSAVRIRVGSTTSTPRTSTTSRSSRVRPRPHSMVRRPRTASSRSPRSAAGPAGRNGRRTPTAEAFAT